MKDVLIIGAAAVAVYAVWKFSQPAATAQQQPTGSASSAGANSLGLNLENAVQAKTGVPVATLGSAAQKAPTWLKIAVFPVGATAVAQGVITHPVDTAKKVGSAISGAAHSVGSFLGF